MVMSLARLESKKDYAGEVQQQLGIKTRPLVRESVLYEQTPNCIKIIKKKKKSWSWVSDGCLTPRQNFPLLVDRQSEF
jgi:hypothetical protein